MWFKKKPLETKLQSFIIYILEYINGSSVSTIESFKTLSSDRKL